MRRRKGEEEGEAATRAPCSNPSREKEREEGGRLRVTSRHVPLPSTRTTPPRAGEHVRGVCCMYTVSGTHGHVRAASAMLVLRTRGGGWAGGLRWEFSRGQPSFPWELHQRQDGGAALGVMGNNGNGQPGRGEMREGG